MCSPTVSGLMARLGEEVTDLFAIDKEFQNTNVPRTIRFTDNLFEELNTLAQNNNISVNLLVLQCCKYSLENKEVWLKELEH